MVESGGLENRCTFTGTVGSNPTLSARNRPGICVPGFQRRGRLIGMAPRWKRGGFNDLCGFESRPLRQFSAAVSGALNQSSFIVLR